MDPRGQANGNRIYEDFEPTFEWAKEDEIDTLLVFLPGFSKEKLKVQRTSAGNLRIMGERLIRENTWSRFRKEIPIPSNCNVNQISAKYENGILFVQHPKIIISVPAEPRKEAKPAAESAQPPEAATPSIPKEDKQQEMIEPPKSQKTPSKELEEGRKQKETTPEIKEAAEPRHETNAVDKKKPDVGNFADANLQHKGETSAARNDTERKDKKPDDSGEGASKMEELAPKYPRLSQIPKATNYKQAIGDFVMNLKKPQNLMTTVVAVLLVVAIGLSVKNAIKSLSKPQPNKPGNTEL